jgi:hypothetical protein
MHIKVFRAREWRIVFPLLACIAGACGSSHEERAAPDSVPRPAQADTAQSPLASYPGFGHDRAAERAQIRRQGLAVQRYIAQCMRKAGFEYMPVPSTVNAPSPPNPNEPYVASLSAERRTQYNLTLYGVPDPNDEENLWDPRSPTGGGCWGEAMRATPSIFAAKSELMTEYDALRRSIERDPRVRAAEERWSACMRSQGFEYARPQSSPAREDSAAIRGGYTPELERVSQTARATSPECVSAVRLDSIKAAVRVEKESQFVRAHKDILDRHVQRLHQQQPLLDSLLAQ